MRRRRVKENADRFAHVPAVTDDSGTVDRALPLRPDPAQQEPHVEEGEAETVSARSARAPRYTAGERPANKPVQQSGSAKRAQPSRRSRSQRGKK